MTDDSRVPDTGPLTFKLWLPRWEDRNGTTVCRFDATPAGLDPLAAGTEECVAEFLADLGAPKAAVRRWTVRRYRSPYFADNPSAADWRDRVRAAWEVEVELDGAVTGTTDRGPHGSQAFDATSLEAEPGPDDHDRVVVIGVPAGEEADAERDDLGELALPADLDRVDAAVEAYRDRGLRTDWRAAAG